MKYQKDLGFVVIKRNQEITPELVRAVSRSFELNRKIFRRKPTKFKVIICDTEKEYKKAAKYYYSKRGTGTVLRNNDLIIKSPDFIEKIGRWKRSDFPKIMDHEMNHVFWTDFYYFTKPCWLLEGFACYIGKSFVLSKKELKEVIKKYKVNSSILEYRYLDRNFRGGHYPRYPVWEGFTRFIAKKHGARKFIKLMDLYIKNPSLSNYKGLFKQLFRKSERELFEDFLKSLKI